MLARGWMAAVLLAGATLYASDRPDFSGTWVTADRNAATPKWQIEQREEDIQVKALEAGDKLDREYKCGTVGKECATKEDEKKGKVSLWYNGPMLVEMYQSKDGKSVVKTQRKLSDDGSTMTVVVVPIVPAGGEPQTFTYKREDQSASRAANPQQ
jgi:hypothetical protein